MTSTSNNIPPFDYRKHWNTVYSGKPVESLGWYEENPSRTLELVERCNLDADSRIFIPGAGSTTLIDFLLKAGYRKVIANDLAHSAMENLKSRIGSENSVEYVVDDLTHPERLTKLEPVDLWIDRAVLHFLIKERDIMNYFKLLKQLVKPRGYAILAEFSLEGAKKCSGLDVVNYSEAMLSESMLPEFQLIESFEYVYTSPSGGLRPYIYTLYQRC